MQTTLQIQVDDEILQYAQNYALDVNKTIPEIINEHLVSISTRKKLEDEFIENFPEMKANLSLYTLRDLEIIKEYIDDKKYSETNPLFIPMSEEERQETFSEMGIKESDSALGTYAFRYKATRDYDYKEELNKARRDRFVEKYLFRLGCID